MTSRLEDEVFAPISEAIRQGEERAMREAGMTPRLRAVMVPVIPAARYRAPGERPDEVAVRVEQRIVWTS